MELFLPRVPKPRRVLAVDAHVTHRTHARRLVLAAEVALQEALQLLHDGAVVRKHEHLGASLSDRARVFRAAVGAQDVREQVADLRSGVSAGKLHAGTQK